MLAFVGYTLTHRLTMLVANRRMMRVSQKEKDPIYFTVIAIVLATSCSLFINT